MLVCMNNEIPDIQELGPLSDNTEVIPKWLCDRQVLLVVPMAPEHSFRYVLVLDSDPKGVYSAQREACSI